ncbi:MAG: patatin-like phospholipase family protein [Pseudomonadota bacterium]
MTTRKALVLGGGGARGAYQLGMLEVLVEQHDFQIIRGVSAGAINAVVLAQAETGPGSHDNLRAQLKQLEQLWLHDIRGPQSVFRKRLFGKLATLFWADSLYTIEPVHALMRKYVSLERLRRSGRDFEVGAVSLVTGRYASYGPDDPHFMDKLVASMSLPPVFPPVEVKDEADVLVDGGMRTITPLASAFEAGAEEIYVLLTSEVLQENHRIPDSSIEEMDYEQWDGSLKRVLMNDVLGRSIGLLMDEIYLQDIKTALQWNNMALGVKELGAALANLPGARQVIERVMQKYRALQRKYVKVHVLAPRERFDPTQPKGDQDNPMLFEPHLIRRAVEHGREIASNPDLWLWRPKDDLYALRGGAPAPQVVQAVEG